MQFYREVIEIIYIPERISSWYSLWQDCRSTQCVLCSRNAGGILEENININQEDATDGR